MTEIRERFPSWAWDVDYRKINRLSQKDIYWLKWKYERVLLYGRDRDFNKLDFKKLKEILPQLKLPREYKWLLTQVLYH